MTEKTSEDRVLQIYKILHDMYPGTYSGLLTPKRSSPLDVLVATILSQATNDILSDRAFSALKERFPSWDAVLDAEWDDVKTALSVGGLQEEKTKKIKGTLAKIRDDFSEITLQPLFSMDSAQAYRYLLTLPGVGPKTAACVLVFALDKPAFPVDTHVRRIARRLNLTPSGTSAAKTQEIMEQIVPGDLKMDLHVLMIRHGRERCYARRPLCQDCPLLSICEGDSHAK